MIRVTLIQLPILYLCLIFGAVLAMWVATDVRRKRRERLARRHKIICTICGAVYEDVTDHDLSQCPECESMNERHKIHDI